MRIYSMTATFGKLEHETLTLEPGLNVIHAPNEWGKSTWCAFLLNMLYGIDTRARSSGTALADKDRYAPWSGAAMSGRMELCWNGRDITIERTSNTRTPMGVFRAYETESGLDVPELTASNCGQQLLGVERSVFAKAGFLRLSELPVTQDEALRRRLNNLVTTGDESGTADKLGQTLKDLKNKCLSNRANGLIPEATEQRAQLRAQLEGMRDLESNTRQAQTRQQELEEQIRTLETHQAALCYAKSQEDARKLAESQEAAQAARDRLEALTEQARDIPTPEAARATLDTANALQEEQAALLSRQQQLPPMPEPPTAAPDFAGMTPAEAVDAARKDREALDALESQRKKQRKQLPLISMIPILAAIALYLSSFVLNLRTPVLLIAGSIVLVAGLIGATALSASRTRQYRARLEALLARHPGQSPDTWEASAQGYADGQAAYEEALSHCRAQTEALTALQEELDRRIRAFTGDRSLPQCRQDAEQAIRLHERLEAARAEAERSAQHAEALRSLVQVVEPPQETDSLRYSAQQTTDLLASARFEQRQLQLKLAQYEGQKQAQGNEAALRAQLEHLNRRINRLEEYYSAIELAQSALSKASATLQRRFAPKISQRAQELFNRLTEGRYRKVVMAEDMSLSTSAQGEDTLRQAHQRSDGTVDQLYLALRLAVAEALTPDAPLVLDDALVRFDDRRLAQAMTVLRESAQSKQVILFTCQDRERQLSGQQPS